MSFISGLAHPVDASWLHVCKCKILFNMSKTVQNAVKICYSIRHVFRLLGDFVPQTPYRGSATNPRWGTSVPQAPRLCSSKISFKNPLCPWPSPFHRPVFVSLACIVFYRFYCRNLYIISHNIMDFIYLVLYCTFLYFIVCTAYFNIVILCNLVVMSLLK